MSKATISYKDSGVDIGANARWVRSIHKAMKSTHGPRVISRSGETRRGDIARIGFQRVAAKGECEDLAVVPRNGERAVEASEGTPKLVGDAGDYVAHRPGLAAGEDCAGDGGAETDGAYEAPSRLKGVA